MKQSFLCWQSQPRYHSMPLDSSALFHWNMSVMATHEVLFASFFFQEKGSLFAYFFFSEKARTIPDSDKYTFAFFPAFSPLVGLTFASSFCCGRKDISEHKEPPQGQNISLQPNHPENHRTAHTGTGQRLIPKLVKSALPMDFSAY